MAKKQKPAEFEPVGTPEISGESAAELDGLKSSLRSDNDRPRSGRRSKASQEAEKNLQEAIDAICNPKILGDIVCSPFDTRRAITGSDIFYVPEETRLRMGVHAATCLKAFELVKDPKWYAVGLLAFEFAKISIEMEVRWRAQKKREKLSQPVAQTESDTQE